MSNILVFHQNEIVRDQLRDSLSKFFKVIVIHDPGQCIEALDQKAGLALAFLDVSPSDKSCSLFLRARAKRPDMKIIAVGNAENEKLAVAAVANGADGYILTPLRNDEILALTQKQSSADHRSFLH